MPFDFTTIPSDFAIPDIADLEKQQCLVRRRRLIEALRQPMPPGFRWDFGVVLRCAMGLAVEIGLISRGDVGPKLRDWKKTMAKAIGISRSNAAKIFAPQLLGIYFHYGVFAFNQITPAMVADKLERLP